MPRTNAVVFPARGQVEFREISVPEMGPDELMVRSRVSWISNGTEGSFLRGERVNGETPWEPGRPEPFPIVAGYQRVGVVTAVGANVREAAPGDLVFVTVTRVEGMYESHGGHVAHGPVHRSQIWKVPAGVDPRALSGLVLTQVGWNCGMRATLTPGDAAVVLGDGMVGQWSAQTLQQRGARVMLLGHRPSRLKLLACREGDRAVDCHVENDLEAIRAWAPEGVQAIVDTVGSVATLERLFPTLRRDGHLVSAGFNGAEGRIDIQMLRFREASLHTPSGWTKARMDATLDWVVDGRLQTLPLVTHTFPARRAADAWRQIRECPGEALGVLLEWEDA
jgi:2-desacetyl-2-hydroxyethyl bacteriochlorophyllide A dehydrogenase